MSAMMCFLWQLNADSDLLCIVVQRKDKERIRLAAGKQAFCYSCCMPCHAYSQFLSVCGHPASFDSLLQLP